MISMARSRKEGKLNRNGAYKVRDAGLTAIMPHLMPNRTDSEVFLHDIVDITELLPYIDAKNSRGENYKTTLFHCIIFAIAKMIYERPYLNRYIQTRTLYERKDISFGFVARRHFADGADECLMTLITEPETTLDEISRKIYGDVTKMRSQEKASDGLDKIIDTIAGMPVLLTMAIVKAARVLDFWGLAPSFFKDGDPNYTTVFLSNLGSIKCPAVYHHLNNYGTNSIMVTIGTIHKEEIVAEDGTKHVRDVVDIGVTLDERLADGFYFIKSLKLVKYICRHPEFFDKPIGEPSGFEYE